MTGLRSLALALLAFAAACASPSGTAQLTGTVSYRERIALPEAALVRVTLLDVSLLDAPERVIAEQEIHPTAQVPIPFTLPFERAAIDPGRRYGLRASIADATGRVLWATAVAHPVLSGGAPAAVDLLVRRVGEGGEAAGPRLFAYACEGFAFRVELTQERALLFLPGRKVTLPHVQSASGAKYSDGDATFWSRGAEVSLRIGGAEYDGCRRQERPLP